MRVYDCLGVHSFTDRLIFDVSFIFFLCCLLIMASSFTHSYSTCHCVVLSFFNLCCVCFLVCVLSFTDFHVGVKVDITGEFITFSFAFSIYYFCLGLVCGLIIF